LEILLIGISYQSMNGRYIAIGLKNVRLIDL